MKTISLELFRFEELTVKHQQNVVNHFYDINTFYDWWEFCYEDAERTGLKINNFNLGRSRQIEIAVINSCYEIAKEIVKNWGKKCNGVTQSKEFIKKADTLTSEINRVHESEISALDEEYEQLKIEFTNELQRIYFEILQGEYEYRTSSEAIIESIDSNDYWFTQDGTVYTGDVD